MGMHVGLVAVSAKTPEVLEAFKDLWSDYEVGDSKSGFLSVDAAFDWKGRNEKFVSAAEWRPDNRGQEVYLLWQDGPWAVLMDSTYVLPTHEEQLIELSRRFGVALGLIVESAAGTGFFRYYERGALVRSIDYYDGTLEASGEPLTAEAGIVVDSFYMDEAEDLCEALGLPSLKHSPSVESLTALCIVDHTDYSDVLPDSPAPVSAPRHSGQKPWWKFW